MRNEGAGAVQDPAMDGRPFHDPMVHGLVYFSL